jgi:phosphate transport system substrate-binding protein
MPDGAPTGILGPLLRGAWTVSITVLFSATLSDASLCAQSFTPPPTLESIPPHPAAADSYEVHLVETLPRYVPHVQVSGVIRLWGHGNAKLPWMRHLVEAWEGDFTKFHPGVRFDYQMHGTSSGIPALFTGVGDIAILGEEILPGAAAAFEKVKGYPPLGIEIMTGSVDVRNFDYAQQFFVHKDNPLRHLTLAQLDAVFGSEHRRGMRNIRTWGELGLHGVWSKKIIVPYGWAIDDSFGAYLQQYLLGGSHQWNCALQEFVHTYQTDGSVYDHGQQILDALARDRYGIAVSNIRYAGPNVKALALGLQPAGPFFQATKETLVDHRYPLARTIPAVIDRAPGAAIDPKVREFLRYLLSRDGQTRVNEDGRYLPLASALIQEQLRKLE